MFYDLKKKFRKSKYIYFSTFSNMQAFDEERFRSSVDCALKQISNVLETTRKPLLAECVPHNYQDKYTLAEFIVNSMLQAQFECLKLIGIDSTALNKLKSWSKNFAVTILFSSEHECTFVREETRKEESNTHLEQQIETSKGTSTATFKVITKKTDYFWKFNVHYEFRAFQGNNTDDHIILQSKSSEYEIKTSTDTRPKPRNSLFEKKVDFSWFLQNLSDDLIPNFKIDRSSKYCFTPRRNDEITFSKHFCEGFYEWSTNIINYFRNELFSIQKDHGLDLSVINDNDILIPVFPIFEKQESTVIIPESDIIKFMNEQNTSIEERCKKIVKVLPTKELITQNEGKFIMGFLHLQNIFQFYYDSINYIEFMLFQQLISAIGKEVNCADLYEFMIFHSRKIFKSEFVPQIFCCSIRRNNHTPEGILSVQTTDGNPIHCFVRRFSSFPMNFSIHAACSITFNGPKYIHAWIDQTFSNSKSTSIQLTARARQFSSFILVFGNLINGTSFNPVNAIIIQNRDDLLIPLLLETIPTPAAFRDAIESLSPEQKEFAKQFRAMQLDSSLMGICVIQIKPQLEKLLNLPESSLTKEIELTQDLIELFIDYQIPSDLLSYDKDINESTITKIIRVKQLVSDVKNMISRMKQEQINENLKKNQLESLKFPPRGRGVPSRPSRGVRGVPGRGVVFGKGSSHGIRGRGGGGGGTSALLAQVPRGASRAGPSKGGCSVGRGGGAPVLLPVSQGVGGGVSNSVLAVPAVSTSNAIVQPPSNEIVQNEIKQTNNTSPVESSSQFKQFENKELDIRSKTFDFTQLPNILDKKFELFDLDSALHGTIVKVGSNPWSKQHCKSLLSSITTDLLNNNEQKTEKQKAFDLLDALSRSGVLEIDEAEFHVMVVATHSFDKTLMDTLIKKNINPIEKLDRSMLIVASTIYEVEPISLVVDEYVPILKEKCSVLC